jgi:hypothetical protein
MGEKEPGWDWVGEHWDVVHEDNWPEWSSRGIIRVDIGNGNLDIAWHYYGVAELYTGDGWDEAAGRPTRDKPREGIYATARAHERRKWMGARTIESLWNQHFRSPGTPYELLTDEELDAVRTEGRFPDVPKSS